MLFYNTSRNSRLPGVDVYFELSINNMTILLYMDINQLPNPDSLWCTNIYIYDIDHTS